jgi:HAD superfamily hydrolase (TIGR01509 family)
VLPEGGPDDPPDAATVHAIATRKNEMVLAELEEHGVEIYPGSVRYLRAAKDAGLATAVVTASANGEKVIEAGGFADLIDVRIDGVVAAEDHLRGKPEPDTFLAGARALGFEPAQAVVYEDAISGVEAGRAGAFGFVVGVDRVGQTDALKAAGADVVVTDLEELMGDRA